MKLYHLKWLRLKHTQHLQSHWSGKAIGHYSLFFLMASYSSHATKMAAARSIKKIVGVAWVTCVAHAMALALTADDFRYALRLDADDPLLQKYLRGETLQWPQNSWPSTGWPEGAYVAICLDRFPLGWAKAQNHGFLKNLYPPGWRKMT